MIGNLQIIYDFKNSKEYIGSYISEPVGDNKVKIKKTPPAEQPLGTFLLDFMNTSFYDYEDFILFATKYLMVHLLSSYDENILGDINNYSIVMENKELQEMFIDIYSTSASDLTDVQNTLELIFENTYYNEILKYTDILSDNYDIIEKLANEEKDYFGLNKFLVENNSTSLDYNLNTFFDNKIPNNLSTNYIFSSSTADCFLYCMVNEFVCNIKNIKFEKCKKCGYWFMHTKSKEQNYCNDIFEDNKTCFEIAKEERARKNEKDDIYLQRCRKRYKNMHKQVTIGASERIQRLFNRYKEQMPKYIEQYKSDLISGEELMEWLECIKIRR